MPRAHEFHTAYIEAFLSGRRYGRELGHVIEPDTLGSIAKSMGFSRRVIQKGLRKLSRLGRIHYTHEYGWVLSRIR